MPQCHSCLTLSSGHAWRLTAVGCAALFVPGGLEGPEAACGFAGHLVHLGAQSGSTGVVAGQSQKVGHQ